MSHFLAPRSSLTGGLMHVMCDDKAFDMRIVEGDVRSVSMVGVPSLSQVHVTHQHTSSE